MLREPNPKPSLKGKTLKPDNDLKQTEAKYMMNLTWSGMKAMANESWFVRYYLVECRGNGVQAYLKVFPNAQYQSAKASASRLLKKPSVIEAMRKKLEKLNQVGKS